MCSTRSSRPRAEDGGLDRSSSAGCYQGGALQLACASGAFRSVEWLTREFPVTTDTCPDWRAALDEALGRGHARLVVLLVERLGIKHDMLAPADFLSR